MRAVLPDRLPLVPIRYKLRLSSVQGSIYVLEGIPAVVAIAPVIPPLNMKYIIYKYYIYIYRYIIYVYIIYIYMIYIYIYISYVL